MLRSMGLSWCVVMQAGDRGGVIVVISSLLLLLCVSLVEISIRSVRSTRSRSLSRSIGSLDSFSCCDENGDFCELRMASK